MVETISDDTSGDARVIQVLASEVKDGFEKYVGLMANLGKYKTGKSCLYVKRLSDIDENVLNELIELSVKYFNDKYGKN